MVEENFFDKMNKEFIAEIEYNNRKYVIEPLTEEDVIHQNIRLKRKEFYELELLEYIKERNLKGVYIDMGANIGNHSLFFATQCPCTKLYCVEASNDIANVLKRNLKRNNIKIPYEVYVCAIRDKKGEVKLSIIPPKHPGNTRVVHDKTIEYSSIVPSFTIDELFEDVTDVAVLKIDIELSEIQAIRGAKKILSKNSPLIATELHKTTDFLEFERIVREYGYKTSKEHYGGPNFIFEK